MIARVVARTMLLLAALIGIALTVGGQADTEQPRNRLPKRQHNTSNAPFLKPEQALKAMAIPAGFDVSIFAAEPDIGEPIAFCFDDRGRLWVVENYNYRTRRNHTDDQVTRIQILEDVDRDGVFDKKKTFTDKLTFTSGIALGFGGVFVGSPPNLSFIPDADGDDVPDGPPQPLLDGWGINDRHETLNSFIWGPDGWLYGCHGVFTHSRVGHPGDADEARQFIDGGIWRYHPVTTRFEVFARGLSNPWGFDFDDHGQSFATCCVIPHLFHVVQGGVYHKQSRPHVNPHIYDDIKTIRDHAHLSAHGGARVYLADAFPEKYHNRLFMCNIHEHAVLTDILEPKGSSFIGRHGDDFMPANDLAWVGFSVEIGPEGGVYILDWHDTDVCGNAINFPNSGRVYRIMPEDAKPAPAPNLRERSDVELVRLQLHPNDWHVRQARVLLHSRAAAGKLDRDAVHKLLNQQFSTAPTTGKRLRMLWALHVTGGLDQARLTALLRHDESHVRAWAIQLLGEASPIHAFQVSHGVSQTVLPANILSQLAIMAQEDPSPTVRLHLASLTQRLPFADRWDILAGLAGHEEDADDHNLPRMIWFALEPMVMSHPQRALDLAVAGKMPRLPEFVARRMVAGDIASELQRERRQSSAEQQRILGRVAAGWRVKNVGELGVVWHRAFKNRTAVQTHPLNRQVPCSIYRKLVVPERARLRVRVAHHPHGDWQLRVLVNQHVIAEELVKPANVTKEWLGLTVDLTPYAGQEVDLELQNRANDWHNEWAYWNEISILTD